MLEKLIQNFAKIAVIIAPKASLTMCFNLSNFWILISKVVLICKLWLRMIIHHSLELQDAAKRVINQIPGVKTKVGRFLKVKSCLVLSAKIKQAKPFRSIFYDQN